MGKSLEPSPLAALAVGLAQTSVVAVFFAATISDRSLRGAYIVFAVAYAVLSRVIVYIYNAREMGPFGALLSFWWMWKRHGDPFFSRLPHHGNKYINGVLYNAILALVLMLGWGIQAFVG